MDFLTIIPFWLFLDGFIDTEYSRLLYMIKLSRLYNGFQLLDQKAFMREIKFMFHKRINSKIEDDSNDGEG